MSHQSTPKRPPQQQPDHALRGSATANWQVDGWTFTLVASFDAGTVALTFEAPPAWRYVDFDAAQRRSFLINKDRCSLEAEAALLDQLDHPSTLH